MLQVVAHIYTRGLLTTYERRYHPNSVNRPVIIVQNNRVADYCAKAKAHGISVGMLKKHAAYNLPNGLFLNYRPDSYQELMEELFSLLESFSPRAEVYQDKEIFIDLTGDKTVKKTLSRLSQALTTVYCDNLIISLAETKLTARACSLAIARLPRVFWHSQVHLEKLDEKIAIAKPQDDQAFLSKLPVQFLWPLQAKFVEQLQFLGLNNCMQLQEIPCHELARHFGSHAKIIQPLSFGIDHSRVQLIKNTNKLIKFCSLAGSSDRLHWEQALIKASQEMSATLSQRLDGFRCLKLIVTCESGATYNEVRKFNRVQYTFSAIKNNACFLLNRLELKERVSSIILCLEEICPVPTSQMELFTVNKGLKQTDETRDKKLAQVINNLNQKYPARLISFGKSLALSRREQMLQFWDPLRFNKTEVK